MRPWNRRSPSGSVRFDMVETVPVRITRGCLAALPSDLHRIFARKLIASGEWELVDDDQANDRRGAV